MTQVQSRTPTLLRQGDLLFLPRPWVEAPSREVRENVPLRDAGGTVHVCELLYRSHDGEVYVRGLISCGDGEPIQLAYWHHPTSAPPAPVVPG